MRLNKASTLYQLRWIYLAAIVNMVFFVILAGPWPIYDTMSYLTDNIHREAECDYQAFYDKIFYNGFPQFRTPVYPTIVWVFVRLLGWGSWQWGVIIFQSIVFLPTIGVFYRLLKSVCCFNMVNLALTAVYAVAPGATTACRIVSTESLATSSMIILLYILYKIRTAGRPMRWVVAYGAFVCVLMMLRPAFVYLLPATFMIGIVCYFVRRKVFKPILLSGVVASMFAGAYCFAYYKNYGMFTLSGVSAANQFVINRTYLVDDPECTADQKLAEYVSSPDNDEMRGNWSDLCNVLRDFPVSVIDDFNAKSRLKHPDRYLKSIYYRLIYSTDEDLIYFRHEDDTLRTTAANILFYLSMGWCLRIGCVYLLILSCIIVFAYLAIKRKRLPWLLISFLIFYFCHTMVILLGAQNDWCRLHLSGLPLFYILSAGLLITLLKIGASQSNRLNSFNQL